MGDVVAELSLNGQTIFRKTDTVTTASAQEAVKSLFFVAQRTQDEALSRQCLDMIDALAERFPVMTAGPESRRQLNAE